ncbi:zinc knuckle-domain-containing protein [Calycina marina]|uniref:Zinc knuckle-domain-containing protein n=1 Tax=Calycina marina TaxID=1763456 RepID=A0A9P7Z7G3_9HELO|nr:zinc knuckle-domain-containing protein [Calycina marina]
MYSRGPNPGGPSRATATTTCQKCLKKGHYSYECKAVVQERPYVSRPSRTQMMNNPELVPKLTSDVPQDLLRKKGVANDMLAKMEEERGRKREKIDDEDSGSVKRRRSSSSVSTISTSMSRSRSRSPPPRSHDNEPRGTKKSSLPPRDALSVPAANDQKKRRRSSVSSSDSYVSKSGEDQVGDYGERTDSRSTRRRYQDSSPRERGRRDSKEWPPVRRGSPARRGPSADHKPVAPVREQMKPARHLPPRERSLSPFSKRLALTRSINSGR